MSEEYARHLCHTDLPRERIVGATGIWRQSATVMSRREMITTLEQNPTLFLLLSAF